jgi:hypothetical protein
MEDAKAFGSCWLGLHRIEKEESIEDSKTHEHSPGMLCLNKHAAASIG